MKEFKLDETEKITSGFTIPEHYFDDFQNKIVVQLPEKKTKVLSLFSQRKTWLFAVAAVLVLALCIPIVNYYSSSNSEIDKTTLETYLSYNANLSDDDIVELLDEKDLQKIKIDLTIEDKDIEDILSTNSNLEEYLTN
jgi:hypothetical protein